MVYQVHTVLAASPGHACRLLRSNPKTLRPPARKDRSADLHARMLQDVSVCVGEGGCFFSDESGRMLWGGRDDVVIVEGQRGAVAGRSSLELAWGAEHENVRSDEMPAPKATCADGQQGSSPLFILLTGRLDPGQSYV